MRVLFKDDTRKRLGLLNLECAEGLICKEGVISNMGAQPSLGYGTQEAAAERFDDIVAADISDTVDLYDMSKPVGYWKDVGPEPEAKPAPTNGRRKSAKTEETK